MNTKIIVPPNEIVAVFGSMRIIKVYHIGGLKSDEIYTTLKLESRKLNSIGEAYYSEAIDDPNERGDYVEQNLAYSLLQEYRNINHALLQELSKRG